MDEFRYGLALVLVVLLPMVIAFWLTIHGGSHVWKTLPLPLAYTTACGVMLAVGVACFLSRATLIGADLGTIWPLFIVGAVIYVASLRLAAPVRKVLPFKTFAGVAQVADEKTTLLADGPYAAVRHPRYFMVLVGTVGWAMMANHAAVYGMAIVSTVGLLLVIYLEERELVVRFGQPYCDYQARVPRLIPAWSDWKRFA